MATDEYEHEVINVILLKYSLFKPFAKIKRKSKHMCERYVGQRPKK